MGLNAVRSLNLQVKDLAVSGDGLGLYEKVQSTRQFQSEPAKKTLLTTRFVAALILFFIVNIVVKLGFHPDLFSMPERTFIWWAVKDYRQLGKAPDILFFGSSLMLAAVNEGDATHYRTLIDTATHHYSTYMQELQKQKYGHSISNFCFAIGGQMASDVYAIATNFIDDKFKPRVIVWGIAPRDLLDAAFPGAITSDTARYMNKIANKEIIVDEHKTLNSVVDKFLQKIVFIYRVRDSFLSSAKEIMRTWQVQQLAWINSLSKGVPSKIEPPPGRQKMLRELMNPRDGNMGDIEIGEWLIGPNAEPSKTLKDNTKEYLTRYNPFKIKTFLAQRDYLEKFLRRQKELGVKVILVNMPLTGVNMSLLPASTYDAYFQTLKDFAKKYNADIFDLNGDPRFNQSDFFDTAHLNGLGSQKFIEVLATNNKLNVSNTNPKSTKRAK
jgi:hypothetical protein